MPFLEVYAESKGSRYQENEHLRDPTNSLVGSLGRFFRSELGIRAAAICMVGVEEATTPDCTEEPSRKNFDYVLETEVPT